MRQEVHSLESSVVVQELELAINKALSVFCEVYETNKSLEVCLGVHLKAITAEILPMLR